MMTENIHIMVRCPLIGCSRSIGYCFKCDYKKGISDYDLICGYRDAIKMKKTAN
jgi:hypothetical protein